MSAIWGKLSYQSMIGKTDHQIMEEPFHQCRIDEFRHEEDEHVLLGFGNQHFTKEAQNEKQPFLSDSYCFVADVMLDNRQELIKRLGLDFNQNEMADGTILFKLLKKFGDTCLPWLLGSFAFFFYDKKNDLVILATDSVGSRVLYYGYENRTLYFSTLQESIKREWESIGKHPKWNKRFLSDMLALNELTLFYEASETAVLDLYKIEPGQVVRIHNGELEKQYYWDPVKNIKERHFITDEECKSEFHTLWSSCVSVCLRARENTGILLSGGLDSTSVACFAAPILKERKEALYSYTSIPEKDFVYQGNSYYLSDEQKNVEKTAAYLGNVQCHFLNLPGKDGWQNAATYARELEMPYKSLQNQCWMEESMEQARQDHCSIMLTGQYGNTTISYGNFETHFATLFCSARFIELYREINAFHQRTHYSRKEIYRDMAGILPARIKEKICRLNKNNGRKMFDEVFVNCELLEQYDTRKRFLQKKMNQGRDLFMTMREYRPFMAFRDALSQLGEMETKNSLYRGVIMRDPTRDKRLIEFCMSLPEEQYVNNGVTRRLVYEYLKSDIPDHIILDQSHKGLQSADTGFRLKRNWNQIDPQLEALLQTEEAAKLLDVEKTKKALGELKEHIETKDNFEVLRLLSAILMIQFVRQDQSMEF